MARIRQGGGFGIIVLLMVLVTILLLASRAWKTVMPTALDVAAPGKTKTAKHSSESLDLPPPSVNSGAGQRQIQSSLGEAKKATDAHSGQVQGALGE